MARRGYPVQGHEGRLKVITGSVTLGSSSVASSTFATESIGTLARTSAGLYTLTLSDTYSKICSAHVAVMAASAADLHAQLVSFSSNVLTFRTVAVATETDGASGVVLYVTLVMEEVA